MIPTDGRSTPRTPVVPAVTAVTCEASPSVPQVFVDRLTTQCRVGLLDRSDTRDTRDVGDAVYGGALGPVPHSALETSATTAQCGRTIPMGHDSAAADALPEMLTLDEITAILLGAQDQQRPTTPSARGAAQRVADLAYRVKECPRCAPLPDRPSNGTTSASCPRHVIEDQVQLLRQRLATPPSSPQAVALRRDEERLGRLLCAVARADAWSGADWALAARTLADATVSVALLREAPVIQYALTVCREATAAGATGKGIAHDAR